MLHSLITVGEWYEDIKVEYYTAILLFLHLSSVAVGES